LILHHHLASGSSLVLPVKTGPAAEALIVVVGSGRGCILKADAPLAGLWVPLRGRLQMGASGADGVLLSGELRITELDANVQAVGRGNALWVAVLGSAAAWRRALDGLTDMPSAEPLLPARHTADRELRRRIVALARASGDATSETAADAVIESVLTLQSQFGEAIERCPGRTYAQRRQVFVRLQRVRNFLGANCHLELDNKTLARMASYSPWHFIRAFRAAYCQTPHAYLVDLRLLRARRLLRTSPLAIAEIALASGFENRCAFSRLFRQRFGVTAGTLRRQPAMTTSRFVPSTSTHTLEAFAL
jgi:AraC family transcriptional regulator